MQIGKLQMRGRKDAFCECTNFLLPSFFMKAISLPISSRVTTSVPCTHFLFFCISIFHLYFTSAHLTFVQSYVFFLIFSAYATLFDLLLEVFSIHGNCFTRKGVKDIDFSLAYHAYVFVRNSTLEFYRFLSVREL